MSALKYILAALALVFMVGMYLIGITPSTSLAALSDSLASTEQAQALDAENPQQVVRYLGIYPEDCVEIHYWKSSDGMNASELAVAQASDSAQVSALQAAFEARVADQKTAFSGYAPEQEAKLASYVLKTRGNYVFYAVGSSEELAAWEAVFDGIQ